MIGNTLEEISAIMLSYQKKHTKKYNIFKVLEMTDREVLMCRILTDFLNPDGFHGKGDKFLRIFLEHILHREDTEEICASARVYKEYPITQDRRIDIVIEAKDVFIPMEVKIHAGEQQAQCFDYFMYAKQKSPAPKVVYLTKWGTSPSEFSRTSVDGHTTLTEQDIFCVSFHKDICRYMDKIMESEEDVLIQEMARQYKEAIQSFTGSAGEELLLEVSEQLLASEQNFRSMLLIEQAATKAKARLLYQVMEELEEQMQPLLKKYGLVPETDTFWYDYREQATAEFYAQRESTYPGLNYLFETVRLPDGIRLWLRIEIEYKLFAGICLFDAEKGEEFDCSNLQNSSFQHINKELASYLDLSKAACEGWWILWWYLPIASDYAKGNMALVPDFKEMNEAAIALSGGEKRRQFAKMCVEVIDSELERVINLK